MKDFERLTLTPIAHIECDYKEKFGIPRQSGLVPLTARIVFEKEFARSEAIHGIEQFSHLWLIWGFSESEGGSLTVRPPRLGGNERIGVFATRSPYRPNPLGLSSVRLVQVLDGTLIVEGADMLDGTPIYDIKPYVPYSDIHADAKGGFADERQSYRLCVNFDEKLQMLLPERLREAAVEILAQDPRPAYQADATRVYGVRLSDFDIRFKVEDKTLTVLEIQKI